MAEQVPQISSPPPSSPTTTTAVSRAPLALLRKVLSKWLVLACPRARLLLGATLLVGRTDKVAQLQKLLHVSTDDGSAAATSVCGATVNTTPTRHQARTMTARVSVETMSGVVIGASTFMALQRVHAVKQWIAPLAREPLHRPFLDAGRVMLFLAPPRPPLPRQQQEGEVAGAEGGGGGGGGYRDGNNQQSSLQKQVDSGRPLFAILCDCGFRSQHLAFIMVVQQDRWIPANVEYVDGNKMLQFSDNSQVVSLFTRIPPPPLTARLERTLQYSGDHFCVRIKDPGDYDWSVGIASGGDGSQFTWNNPGTVGSVRGTLGVAGSPWRYSRGDSQRRQCVRCDGADQFEGPLVIAPTDGDRLRFVVLASSTHDDGWEQLRAQIYLNDNLLHERSLPSSFKWPFLAVCTLGKSTSLLVE